MRLQLTNPYVIGNSGIFINVFSKRIEKEERNNEVMAMKMSMQLRRHD